MVDLHMLVVQKSPIVPPDISHNVLSALDHSYLLFIVIILIVKSSSLPNGLLKLMLFLVTAHIIKF